MIEKGVIIYVKHGEIIYQKKYKEKNNEKRVCEKVPAEKSIEFRPEEANNRSEYWHWEGDLVIGKREKGAVLLALTERKTQYAHPYRSCEKGSNENCNRLIRRFVPKGTDINKVSVSFIKFVQHWINNFPRPMFDFKFASGL